MDRSQRPWRLTSGDRSSRLGGHEDETQGWRFAVFGVSCFLVGKRRNDGSRQVRHCDRCERTRRGCDRRGGSVASGRTGRSWISACHATARPTGSMRVVRLSWGLGTGTVAGVASWRSGDGCAISARSVGRARTSSSHLREGAEAEGGRSTAFHQRQGSGHRPERHIRRRGHERFRLGGRGDARPG